ncbi:serine protease, partial [Clavibacter michiganensis subsp. michiganensis]|nr:serine protease [Clavibacter michiganensis subsp. michiganensis]
MRIRSTTAPTPAGPSAPRPRSRRAVAALALAGGLASAAVLAVPSV